MDCFCLLTFFNNERVIGMAAQVAAGGDSGARGRLPGEAFRVEQRR